MPTFIPVGEWLPDFPSFQNPGALVARNVIPAANSYIPFPQANNVSSNVLGGRAQGAIVAIDQTNASYNYAGDVSALYVLVSGNSYSVVTRLVGGAYTVAADDYWEFVQWGQTVIAVNGRTGNDPQQISLGAANFALMSGAPDKASHLAVIRDFVVMGSTSASPQEVRWSAINNANSWTADPATLADSQQLLGDGGFIQRIIGGEYGIIMQERAIYRMTFVGSPLIFQFDQVHRGVGALVPQAVTTYKNLVFFLSENGFYSFDGSNLIPIGANKVDRYFFDNVDIDSIQRITSEIDPTNKIVAWAFRSTSSTTPNNNSNNILLYQWELGRWSMVEDVNIEIITRHKSLGYTLDGLDSISTDLDSILISLDSPTWNSGSLLISAFNNSHRLVSFDGSSMQATVDTNERQLNEYHRSMVREIWPVVHNTSVSTIAVSTLTRNTFTDAVNTGSSMAINSTGFAPTRSSARYHRFRVQVSAGAGYSDIQGVMVDASREGMR